jgi:hypothetical protein
MADRIIWAALLPRIPLVPPPGINNGPPSLNSDCLWGCWQEHREKRSRLVDSPLESLLAVPCSCGEVDLSRGRMAVLFG